MSAVLTFLAGMPTWLGRVSLQAGILIVLILVAQGLLRERLAPRWRHGLWFLLVLRLLLPWTPPSPLSLYNWVKWTGWAERTARTARTERTERTLAAGTQGTLAKGVEAVGRAAGMDGTDGRDGTNGTYRARGVEAAVSEGNLTEGRHATPLEILGLVWAGGVAFFFGVALWQNHGLGRVVQRRRPVTDQATLDLLEECKETLGMHAWLAVVEAPGLRSPALFGFIRPRLLLPQGAVGGLGPRQLRHVFLHELAHLKRHDIALNWLLTLLQAVHWFNPLVWLAFYRMRSDRELACDTLVLEHLRPDEPAEYGRTILTLLERYAGPRRVPALAGILEDKGQIKRRIRTIAGFRKVSLAGSFAAALLMATLAMAALTSATKPAVKDGWARAYEPDPLAVGYWDCYGVANEATSSSVTRQDAMRNTMQTGTAGLALGEGGTTSGAWRWTKGWFWHPGTHVESEYLIRTINGAPFIFIQSKLFVDSTFLPVKMREQMPKYFVLKKTTGNLSAGEQRYLDAAKLEAFPPAGAEEQLEPGVTTLEDVKRIFGQPLLQYGPGLRDASQLLIMVYPHGFYAYAWGGKVTQITNSAPGYTLRKLEVGSTLEDAMAALGPPLRIDENTTRSASADFENGVLYKDLEGVRGRSVYYRDGVGVALRNGRVSAVSLIEKKASAPKAATREPSAAETARRAETEAQMKLREARAHYEALAKLGAAGKADPKDLLQAKHDLELAEADLTASTDAAAASAAIVARHDAELAQAEATVQNTRKENRAVAQARLEYAKAHYENIRKLQEGGKAGTEEFLQAERDFKIAQAEYDGNARAAAQARMEYAKGHYENIRKLQEGGKAGTEEFLQAERDFKIAQAEYAEQSAGDSQAQVQERLEQVRREIAAAEAELQAGRPRKLDDTQIYDLIKLRTQIEQLKNQMPKSDPFKKALNDILVRQAKTIENLQRGLFADELKTRFDALQLEMGQLEETFKQMDEEASPGGVAVVRPRGPGGQGAPGVINFKAAVIEIRHENRAGVTGDAIYMNGERVLEIPGLVNKLQSMKGPRAGLDVEIRAERDAANATLEAVSRAVTGAGGRVSSAQTDVFSAKNFHGIELGGAPRASGQLGARKDLALLYSEADGKIYFEERAKAFFVQDARQKPAAYYGPISGDPREAIRKSGYAKK